VNNADIILTERFVLFWNGWASQWFPSPFTLDGVYYGCCEQFMMAEKARVFDDEDSLRQILAAHHPREQKSLGRKVRDFDAGLWNSACRGVVFTANLAKFSQNDALRERLLNTGDRTIVEASPVDTIWGIGLAPNDPKACQPDQWRGTNWLGIALMQTRDALVARSKNIPHTLPADLQQQLDIRQTLPRRLSP
jgi:ribA/ribD-fused uncharacterized protein